MVSQRIVVTGASGLLGRAIMGELREEHIVGLAYSRAVDPLQRLDLTDTDAVRECLDACQPTCIIHAAAERRPDVSEKDPEGTLRLNVHATRALAQWAATASCHLIYLSTDYVFDGTAPPYTTDATPHPLNGYGESKLAGERAIQESGCRHTLLRVPILYGEVETLDESPVTVLAKQLLTLDGPEAFDAWAVRYPTHVADVARACHCLLDRLVAQDPHAEGMIHVAGIEALTKYDMARHMCGYLKVNPDWVVPNHEPPAGAPRPKNSQLDCSSSARLGFAPKERFDSAIMRILAPHV